ncbi:hypothetical protein EPUS_05965 [Endocarpon pusillum Z07020]|uniref:Clr5 domain-containing protein n=1 Tax=Endocarpon pusillum (strain Z07020 / HMAS-L-300199) TaxID=1263415 RepID=U1HGY4_ENDPU|nr:uncharacterized protein EPUS_05965 [Endocarpon pusillum Z07020]ERF69420.1 hypothetical protein EPUS_05965 [Endocarpon pusillum Z07020]
MTLDALIEHMNVNHHFTASRHQYKLRFDKWQLPKLKTISRKPQGSTLAITSVRQPLSDGHSFAASSETTTGQAEPGLGKPPRAELSGNSSATQDISTCGSRVESAGQSDVNVTSMTSHSETEPDVALVLREGLLLERLPEIDGPSVEKLNIINNTMNLEEVRPAPTASALTPIIDTKTAVPLLPVDRSSPPGVRKDIYTRLVSKFMSSEKILNALPNSSTNVLDAIRKADVLLVVGSYQQAYKLYSRWWERVLVVYSKLVDNPFIVLVASNMSRAASSPAEIAHVVAIMKRFIGPGIGDVKLDHLAECTLLIQLAILLRRVHGFDEAYSYFHHALSIWELWSSVHQEGWGVPANLIGQYIEANSIHFLAQPGKKLSLDLQRRLVEADYQYQGRLRKLVFSCASTLASHNTCWKLAEGVNAGRKPEWDSETIRIVLSKMLFCELWKTFTCEVDQDRTPLIDKVEGLHEMCKGMRISSPDLFAAISILLVDIASLKGDLIGISMSTWSAEAESISLHLSDIDKSVHHIVSEKLSQAEFYAVVLQSTRETI